MRAGRRAAQGRGRRAASAEAIDVHGVCLCNNRQLGRRIKEGMHANLLNCINMELWFGGRAPAELRAWRLGRCLLDAPRVWRVGRDVNERRMRRRQSQLSHAYGLEYLRIPSLDPVVRRKTDHLAWARMGTDGCRGCMVITYEA